MNCCFDLIPEEKTIFYILRYKKKERKKKGKMTRFERLFCEFTEQDKQNNRHKIPIFWQANQIMFCNGSLLAVRYMGYHSNDKHLKKQTINYKNDQQQKLQSKEYH